MLVVYPAPGWLTIEHTFVYGRGVGYRGKLSERDAARRLRAAGWTMPDIAAELRVSRSSVSLWTRDVPVARGPRRRLGPRQPNALERRKAAEIADLMEAGQARIGRLGERDLLIAGTALYAGEGSKTGHAVGFTNTDPRMVALFCVWLRRFFVLDERRLRVRLYLHEGLDLDAAMHFWSEVTDIPLQQFGTAYRTRADPSRRANKHEHGCATVIYSCSRTQRAVMGLVQALLGSTPIPG
ncbi:MAG TPA: hypothetical protein VHF91_04640 [Acidimicrobiales bacterium]|nr:hypothetical protein [Acidimicrobiales bacterium]